MKNKHWKVYVKHDFIKNERVDRFTKKGLKLELEPTKNMDVLIELDKNLFCAKVDNFNQEKRILFVNIVRLDNNDYEEFKRERKQELEGLDYRLTQLEDLVNVLYKRKADSPKKAINNEAPQTLGQLLERLNNE